MVASEIIRIRLKPDVKTSLSTVQKFAGFSDISKTVRHLIHTGLNFYQQREKVIDEIKGQIITFTIKPEELYPGIKIKRKYLGR